MSMAARSYEKELLDNSDIPYNDLLINLRELNVVNTFLGGHKITCSGIDYFLNKTPIDKALTIAEIGCGGGDNLFAIQKHLNKKRRRSKLIGVDIKPECINYAKSTGAGVDWICSDYRSIIWPDGKPDIIFSSLFCHHFSDNELVTQLQWMKENSRMGFFINDLHRHLIAYHSIKILTRIFSRSYLVKNDAPLSVKRGFKKKDWIKMLSATRITAYNVKWQWAFRYLICSDNE